MALSLFRNTHWAMEPHNATEEVNSEDAYLWYC